MTDTQLFLCVVVLFYLAGRCWWLPKGTVAFESAVFHEYRPQIGSSYIGNHRGSLLFADPFIPLRPLYLVDSTNVFLSFEVIAFPSLNSEEIQSTISIPYDAIESIVLKGKAIEINETLAIKCRTEAGARRLHCTINALRQQSSKHRQEEIRKQMRQRFNVRYARKRLRRSKAVLGPLRFNCNVWLAAVSTVYISIALRFGQQAATLPLLICFEIAAVHLGVTFYRLHAIFFSAERRTRIAELLKFILCPPTVFRSVDAISSDLLAEFDPIVVAYLVCPRPQFEKFCNRSLRSLRFNRHFSDPDQQEWFMSEFEDSLRYFLETIGMTADECMPAPRPLDSFSRSYCPRCEVQYEFEDGLCPECDLPVLALAEEIRVEGSA